MRLLGPRRTVNISRLDVREESLRHNLVVAAAGKSMPTSCIYQHVGRIFGHVLACRRADKGATLLVAGPFRGLIIIPDLARSTVTLVPTGLAALLRLLGRLFGAILLLKLMTDVDLLDVLGGSLAFIVDVVAHLGVLLLFSAQLALSNVAL